ncbi:MAG: AAA family ATPase [Eubacterium sp.]|nr:AAA family ATPase [Eubacterium sp.]
MNIEEARKQIQQAVSIYLAKDAFGNYRIPVEKQRPVFLLGAPGIGKTAIMEQIAKEMGVALVTYSMTHHTRQSALGLPFIAQESYGGETYDVSKYTMSEIIASVYETMEKSGKQEGILFLDEINCVSETLAPSMLQFLQYKIFGNHKMPKGWVVVTAGNPPEYNKSVREFDIATLDRLKVLEVEPEFDTWKLYAEQKGLHKSILTYLDIRNDDFYEIASTVDGKSYVTARGWEDLSEAIFLYEEKGYPVDATLISQYLHSTRITEEFATYYELYRKYRTDYQIYDILHGCESEDVRRRAASASFDERITIMGLLMEAIMPEIREQVETEEALKTLLPELREIRDAASGMEGSDSAAEEVVDALEAIIAKNKMEMQRLEAANGLTEEEQRKYAYPIAFAAGLQQKIRLEHPGQAEAAFAIVRADYQKRVQAMQARQTELSGELDHLFWFVEDNFGSGNEMLVLVTNLTVSKTSAQFIAEHGCDAYFRFNEKFMMHARGGELLREAEAFELEL